MKFPLLVSLALSSLLVRAQSIETVIQKGHELAVVAMAVSPDSNFVATGSRDKSAKLWELRSGREVRSFLGHEGTVTSLDFSHDGKYLITGSGDQTARVWEVITGKEVLQVHPDKERLTDVVFDPNGKYFITVGYGRKACVWSFPDKIKLHEFPADGYAGSSGGIHLAISPDGKWFAIGEDNKVATVYRTADWTKTHTFNVTEGSCGGCFTDVAFTPDSRFLIKASYHGPVGKYSLTSGKAEIIFQKNAEELSSVRVSRDGQKIVVCAKRSFTIYDAVRGDSLYTFSPETKDDLTQATFTADGTGVLLANEDNNVIRWDLKARKQIGELTGFLNRRDPGGLSYNPNSYWDSYIAKYVRFKNNVLLSRDNKTLLKGKFGTKVKRWDIATGRTEMEYNAHTRAALCYQYSRDGRILLTGGADGRVILWDADKGDTIRVFHPYREPVFDVSFSHDETKVLSSSWDGSLTVYNVTGELRHDIRLANGSAYLARFTQNDLYIFTANLPTGLQLIEPETQKVIRDFVGHTETVSAISLSQDGRRLLSASWDGSIRLWDIASGLMEQKWDAHHGGVYAAIFSGDEKMIFSAGADRVVRQWEAASGKLIQAFAGHQAEVTSVQLTSDEKMLITHSVDGVTKCWDLASHKEFFEHIHFGEKEWMVKNPEGFFNATQEARRYIHFVDGLKTFAVDQFFDEFYRPDLLPKIFQNRGGDDGRQGIQDRLQKSPPPTVKVAAVPADGGQADLFVKILDNGAGVENLKLFHNGKSIAVDLTRLKLPHGKDQSAVYRHTVALVGGTNTFSAAARNKDNIESDSQPVELFSDATGKTSVCYVMAVGINQYKNPRMTLNYARPDAESFEKLMGTQAESLYKHVEVAALFDGDANRAAILHQLDLWAARINPEDVFIFYYAGHGSMVDDRFFFVPTESARLYDLAALQRDAIEASVLQEKFRNIHALKQLIVMDACQSGGSVELLASRGAAEEKAIAQLSRSAGIHVMASAGSEQFAAEFAELGHGLFTYLLIKGLQGDADGAPKDGKVTIYELKSYLDDQVPELTQKLKGKPQYPYTFSRGQDFPAVIHRP